MIVYVIRYERGGMGWMRSTLEDALNEADESIRTTGDTSVDIERWDTESKMWGCSDVVMLYRDGAWHYGVKRPHITPIFEREG